MVPIDESSDFNEPDRGLMTASEETSRIPGGAVVLAGVGVVEVTVVAVRLGDPVT